MTTQYEWTVASMSCYAQADGETDVVFTANWICVGTDGSYVSQRIGSTAVNYTTGSPFTPYADLTQSQVLSWIWEVVNKGEVEAQVQSQIDYEKAPTIVQLPLPWATPSA
jgi:hypothetical protein